MQFHLFRQSLLIALFFLAAVSPESPVNTSLTFAAPARTIYVAPNGTPTAAGSRANPLDIFTAITTKSPAKPGDTIVLLGGVYEGKMDGSARVPFELSVSGTASQPITIMAADGQSVHLNGTATLTSSYAYYVDLDIGDLKWDPTQKRHQAASALDARSGTGSKIINCNFFGGAMGMAAWTAAINLETYGCLIHDFGSVEEPGRGHGHAWYAQNKDGTKVFANNIAYRGYGWNVHIYTQEGDIQGFDILDNICYIGGALKSDQTVDNYLISGYRPADRIRMIGNLGYQPANVDKWRPNARLSSYGEAANGTGVFKDNYLMGAPIGLLLSLWKDLTVEGNTFWAYDSLIEMTSARTDLVASEYKINNNTYLSNGSRRPFKFHGENMDFDNWMAMGFDRHSNLVQTRNARPSGTRTFIFANKYRRGRANIGVFNWDGRSEVSVDVSAVLRKGQKFKIYNCLDIRQTIAMAKPVLEMTYTGSEIRLPMRRDKMSPDFDAFLVLPQE